VGVDFVSAGLVFRKIASSAVLTSGAPVLDFVFGTGFFADTGVVTVSGSGSRGDSFFGGDLGLDSGSSDADLIVAFGWYFWEGDEARARAEVESNFDLDIGFC